MASRSAAGGGDGGRFCCDSDRGPGGSDWTDTVMRPSPSCLPAPAGWLLRRRNFGEVLRPWAPPHPSPSIATGLFRDRLLEHTPVGHRSRFGASDPFPAPV